MAKTSIVKSFLKQTPIYLSAIVLGIILGMAIQMAYAAWTNPTTFPPNNNAPAPINVSTTTQTKAGSLIVATASGSYLGIGDNAYRLEKDGDSLAFVNKGGETKMIIGNDGNVGIGTTAPTQKLDVAGNVKANDYYITSTNKWVSSLGSPLWTKSGSNIYYNSGRVGIGTINPQGQLEIVGGPHGAKVYWEETLGNYGHDVYTYKGHHTDYFWDSSIFLELLLIEYGNDTCDGFSAPYACPIDATKSCVDYQLIGCHPVPWSSWTGAPPTACDFSVYDVTCKKEYRMAPVYIDQY